MFSSAGKSRQIARWMPHSRSSSQQAVRRLPVLLNGISKVGLLRALAVAMV